MRASTTRAAATPHPRRVSLPPPRPPLTPTHVAMSDSDDGAPALGAVPMMPDAVVDDGDHPVILQHLLDLKRRIAELGTRTTEQVARLDAVLDIADDLLREQPHNRRAAGTQLPRGINVRSCSPRARVSANILPVSHVQDLLKAAWRARSQARGPYLPSGHEGLRELAEYAPGLSPAEALEHWDEWSRHCLSLATTCVQLSAARHQCHAAHASCLRRAECRRRHCIKARRHSKPRLRSSLASGRHLQRLKASPRNVNSGWKHTATRSPKA